MYSSFVVVPLLICLVTFALSKFTSDPRRLAFILVVEFALSAAWNKRQLQCIAL